MLLGSVTELRAQHAGAHAIVGSHGGAATGQHAASVGVASLIVHDAGIGLEEAGIAALDVLQRHGIPAAAVSHDSARIGDAEDMLSRGVISASNAQGRAVGVVVGSRAGDAHQRLARSEHSSRQTPSDEAGARFQAKELPRHGNCRMWLLDSASLITDEMARGIVVTGSHGGLPGGTPARAAKADLRFCVFNDAGIGRDEAGTSRLGPLDTRAIPAACVDVSTARIGEAASTYETGRISRVNDSASRLGVHPGQSVPQAIEALLASDPPSSIEPK